MCKIPLSKRSSTVKTKNNTIQWKKEKKCKIRNCSDQKMSSNNCLSKKFLASPLIASVSSCRLVTLTQMLLTLVYLRLIWWFIIMESHSCMSSVSIVMNDLVKLLCCMSPLVNCVRPIVENVMSYTKLELHNIVHCRQRRSKPQVKCIENFIKFGHMVFEICNLTEKQTNSYKQTDGHKHTDHNTLYPYQAKIWN